MLGVDVGGQGIGTYGEPLKQAEQGAPRPFRRAWSCSTGHRTDAPGLRRGDESSSTVGGIQQDRAGHRDGGGVAVGHERPALTVEDGLELASPSRSGS